MERSLSSTSSSEPPRRSSTIWLSGTKPRTPSTETIRPPLLWSTTSPVTTSSESFLACRSRQPISARARLIEITGRPSAFSGTMTTADTWSPRRNAISPRSFWSSLVAITASILPPISTRISSRSTSTTVPSTSSPRRSCVCCVSSYCSSNAPMSWAGLLTSGFNPDCASCLRGVARACSSGRSAASSIPSKKQPTFALGRRYFFESIRECPGAPRQSPSGAGAAAFQGSGQGYLVGVFEVAAHGQPARQTGDVHAQRGQATLQVASGGVAFHVRVGGQDDLLHAVTLDASDELLDLQVFDGYPVQRIECTVQHVVQAFVDARALQRHHRQRLLDHAARASIALI